MSIDTRMVFIGSLVFLMKLKSVISLRFKAFLCAIG